MLVLWFGLYSHFGRPVTKTLRLYLCDICVCEWCIMNEIFSSLSLQRSIFFSRLFQSIRSLSLTSLNCPLKLLVDLYVGEALLISICVIFLCFNLCFHFTFLSSINRFGVLYAAFFLRICSQIHNFFIPFHSPVFRMWVLLLLLLFWLELVLWQSQMEWNTKTK